MFLISTYGIKLIFFTAVIIFCCVSSIVWVSVVTNIYTLTHFITDNFFNSKTFHGRVILWFVRILNKQEPDQIQQIMSAYIFDMDATAKFINVHEYVENHIEFSLQQ